MLCEDCCRTTHKFLPLHRVETWQGDHFEQAWLWQNGIILHLGHGGEPCDAAPPIGVPHGPSAPTNQFPVADNEDSDWSSDESDSEDDARPVSSTTRKPKKPKTGEADPFNGSLDTSNPRNSTMYPVLTVVDVTGIHELPVHYCICHPHPISNDMQLFDHGLFPATFKRSKTVFTFRVMDDYRLDNLESKTTAYHYYKKLRRVTNPAFPEAVKVISFISLLGL